MKFFIRRLIVFFIISFVVLEIFSRLFIDPFYFYATNTYNEKASKSLKYIFTNKTAHVDYLFVGSSRIPATINTSLLKELTGGKTVINAGRGYMTAGINYQALQNKIQHYPDYLRNASVFMEYSGPGAYTFISDFEEDKMKVYEPVVKTDKPMPSVLLPHLDASSLFTYFKESENSFAVKMEMLFLQSSIYRSIGFINERFNNLSASSLVSKQTNKLVAEGGIRNDNMEAAREKAVTVAGQEKKKIEAAPLLTNQELDKSSLSKLNDLVTQNGGKLYLYKMPLHTIQQEVYDSPKAIEDKMVFENWLKTKNIVIVYNSKFKFSDADFPDTWHLREERRDEFTSLLFDEIKKTAAGGIEQKN